MLITLGYLLLSFTRWCRYTYRRAMYMKAVRQTFQTGSLLIQRTSHYQTTAGRSLVRSSLVSGSLQFQETRLLADNCMILTHITPKQRVKLGEWTAYLRTQGHFEEDRNHEEVMVLLEACRPENLEQFVERECDVAPANKVHVLAHGSAVAWKSGTPFGILLHCSLEEFVTLAMAFVDGDLTMDEDLEVNRILTVDTVGKAASLLSEASSSSLAACEEGNTNQGADDSVNRQIFQENGGAMASLSPQRRPGDLDENQDQRTDLWSNESLASNSSVGKVDLLELSDNNLDNDDFLEGSIPDSGSGEGLSEFDLNDLEGSESTAESMGQSWKYVRMSSISKPPNILIYTGKKDSLRKFEKVRSILEQCIDMECYVIYHLKHDEVLSTPWVENTAFLFTVSENLYPEISDAFQRYFLDGGKIFSIGSSYDSVLLGRKEIRAGIGLTLFSYRTWTDISLIGGKFVYTPDVLNTEGILVSKVAHDSEKQCVIAKIDQRSKQSNGCAILSQVLFDKDPEDLAVTPEIFNTLKQCNTDRFEVLRELLVTLGMDCNPQSPPLLTPAYLITQTENLKSNFMKAIKGRLVNGVLKSGTLSLKFAETARDPVTESLLPVVIVNKEPVEHNFDAETYMNNLETKALGNTVLYVDVVPTTMPLLDGLLFSVPQTSGLIAITRQQTKGKGRGGNAWLSPLGCAMFTMHVQIELDSPLGRSVSYIQHIVSLAVINSVCDLPGYKNIDLRLKWPNDIYYGRTMKLGGVIVKSTVMEGTIHATIGCGFNVSNSNPTICINDLIQLYNRQQGDSLQVCSAEQLIGRTVTAVEQLIDQFQGYGPESFKQLYYDRWLHSDTKVTLQSEGNIEVNIVGLDDYGYLLVETPSGEKISVQPDGNSFDMMQNLISMKTR